MGTPGALRIAAIGAAVSDVDLPACGVQRIHILFGKLFLVVSNQAVYHYDGVLELARAMVEAKDEWWSQGLYIGDVTGLVARFRLLGVYLRFVANDVVSTRQVSDQVVQAIFCTDRCMVKDRGRRPYHVRHLVNSDLLNREIFSIAYLLYGHVVAWRQVGDIVKSRVEDVETLACAIRLCDVPGASTNAKIAVAQPVYIASNVLDENRDSSHCRGQTYLIVRFNCTGNAMNVRVVPKLVNISTVRVLFIILKRRSSHD